MSIYFMVPKGASTFEKLTTLFIKVKAAHDAAEVLTKELGATRAYYDSWYYLAGNISGFRMEEKPEGWRVASGAKDYQGIYFPKADKKLKEVREKIADLPGVRMDELTAILNYNKILSRPGLQQGNNYFLIEIGTGGIESNKYEPLPDMEEITGSKFLELSERIKKESEQSNSEEYIEQAKSGDFIIN